MRIQRWNSGCSAIPNLVSALPMHCPPPVLEGLLHVSDHIRHAGGSSKPAQLLLQFPLRWCHAGAQVERDTFPATDRVIDAVTVGRRKIGDVYKSLECGCHLVSDSRTRRF